MLAELTEMSTVYVFVHWPITAKPTAKLLENCFI